MHHHQKRQHRIGIRVTTRNPAHNLLNSTNPIPTTLTSRAERLLTKTYRSSLAALRSYRRAMGHLAPRQDAVWGEGEAMVPVGQHMANLRRKGGLGKDAKRAAERAKQLAAVDEDWTCPWPLDWQRHYRVLADLVDADGVLPAIEPGVLFEGDDLGKWLERQKQSGTWAQLLPEQQERLSALGVQPLEAPSPAPAAKGAAKGPEQGAVGIPTRPGGLRAVGRTGRRRPTGPARSQRRDRGRRRDGADGREARRMGLEYPREARQAHPGTVGGAAGAGRGMGVTPPWLVVEPDGQAKCTERPGHHRPGPRAVALA